MNRRPSIGTLMWILSIDRDKAKKIREIMGLKYTSIRSNAMSLIDEVLGTYGVEYIPAGHNNKSPSITYCNTGDAYKPTVMLLDDWKWAVGSWRDIVERGNYD